MAAPLPRPRRQVDARTVICVLTHDPKFDVPLLEAALRTPAAYIGAMGSRRTHEDRLARLREAGLTEDELARLSSPIGLDIGARTPEETAVSIAAEIVLGALGRLRAPGSPRPRARSTARRSDEPTGEPGRRARGDRARDGGRAGARGRRGHAGSAAPRRWPSSTASGWSTGRYASCALGGCDPVVVVLGAAVVDVPGADAVVVNEDWADRHGLLAARRARRTVAGRLRGRASCCSSTSRASVPSAVRRLRRGATTAGADLAVATYAGDRPPGPARPRALGGRRRVRRRRRRCAGLPRRARRRGLRGAL